MKTTKQAMRRATQLFRACLLNGRIDESRARLVVQEVLRSKRRGYLAVLGHFMRLLKLEYARRTASIESAVPLPTDLQAKIHFGLERVYGSGLTALFTHDAELIGGVRIKIGSDVYDNSVRSTLAALAKSLGITGGAEDNPKSPEALRLPTTT